MTLEYHMQRYGRIALVTTRNETKYQELENIQKVYQDMIVLSLYVYIGHERSCKQLRRNKRKKKKCVRL